MNIISSNCINGRIHEILKIPYDNSFVWNSIKLSDFCCLIKNYDKINMLNIRCDFSEFQNKKRSTIILDNLINIYFTHHIQDDRYSNPIKDGNGNILYNKMLEYIKEKWFKRNNKSEHPIFIYDDIKSYTDIDIIDFINLETNYKRLLITENKELLRFSNEKLFVYIKPENNYHTLKLSNELLNNDKVKTFLEINENIYNNTML